MTGRATRGRVEDKRRAIMAAALSVFSRDGYSRASVDTIARQADVSTRTLYNHFQDKANLFAATIEESATQVAAAQIDLMDRHLRKIADLEADLIDFGRAWATPSPEHAAHFALVRQIQADAEHLPEKSLRAWREAGPLRVRRELAGWMRRLVEQGFLRVDNAERAANHFVALVTSATADRTRLATDPAEQAEIDKEAAAGIRVFLRAYHA
jgi:AcrR family transcriptional regulator